MKEEINQVISLSEQKKWKEGEYSKICSDRGLILDGQKINHKKREEKAARKEARANRKRLPKRQPVTLEMYRLLLQVYKSLSYTLIR